MLKKLGYGLYAVLFAPICFAIYYAVPASDDFGSAAGINGESLIESIAYVYRVWSTWVGRWFVGIVLRQLNPLNSHVHLGHSYGIYMIVFFLITNVVIIGALTIIVKRIIGEKSKYVPVVTFLIMAMFLTTNYYSECYSWYNGAMTYVMPMMFVMVAAASMIRYTESDSKKRANIAYFLMIIGGIFAATTEIYDVALGITYLYFVYYCHLDERKSEMFKLKIKNAIPLLIYIIFGMSSVFAPGNSLRKEYYEVEVSAGRSFVQYIIDVIIRLQDMIVDHPLFVWILIVLLFIGIMSNNAHEQVKRIPEVIVLFVIIITGAVYPYIYARAFDTTYMDVRMEYVLDFCLCLALGILAVMIGRYLNYRFIIDMEAKDIVMSVAGLVVFFYVALIQNYAYLDILQMDILRNRGLITESYAYYDGVLSEIENSTDDEVIIERDYVPTWSPYILPVGIENGEVYDVVFNKAYDEEHIMINVYYGKQSIQMVIGE